MDPEKADEGRGGIAMNLDGEAGDPLPRLGARGLPTAERVPDTN